MSRSISRTRYSLKRPTNGRRTFAIMVDTIHPDGQRKQRPLSDNRIDAINKAYLAGIRDKAIAEAEIHDLLGTLREEEIKRRGGRPVFSEENQRLLEAYWKAEYEQRDIVGVEQARARLKRALEVLGPKSLLTIDKNALQTLLNRRYKGNKQRDRAAALNQLLKFSGRKFELMLAKPERRLVRYLSAADVATALRHVEEPYRSLYGACFATGARVGEAFSFTPGAVKEQAVFIDRQLDDDFFERETKNRRNRHAPIIPQFRACVEQWAATPEKAKYRRDRLAERLQEACVRAGVKPITVHDLRHSYAVHLLGRGVSLSMVAQCLANSIQVCQEYYAGFTLTADNVDAVAHKL